MQPSDQFFNGVQFSNVRYSSPHCSPVQWGLEYQTSSVFGWSKVVRFKSQPFEIRTLLAQVVLHIFFSLHIKRPRLMWPFCFCDHSKTELWRPFCLVFEWSYQSRPFYVKKLFKTTQANAKVRFSNGMQIGPFENRMFGI